MKIAAIILKIAACIFSWFIILVFGFTGAFIIMIGYGANKPAELTLFLLFSLVFCLSGIMILIPNKVLLSTKFLTIPFVLFQLIVAGYITFLFSKLHKTESKFFNYPLLFGAYAGLLSLLFSWISAYYHRCLAMDKEKDIGLENRNGYKCHDCKMIIPKGHSECPNCGWSFRKEENKTSKKTDFPNSANASSEI